MLLSKAVEGFVISRQADGISPRTIQAYHWSLDPLIEYLENPELETITTDQLREFLSSLRARDLSEPSIQIAWRSIRAFYTWATEALKINRPDMPLKRPTGSGKPVHPYDEDEVKRLLKACEYTTPSQPGKNKSFVMHRSSARRDRALVLLLLDTGLRAGEFSRLIVSDIDLTAGEVEVRPYLSGKKSRSRYVYLGQAARKALWLYWQERGEMQSDDPAFLTRSGHPFDQSELLHLVVRLGIRASVSNAHPHRFRHTFAIQYLRGGGDIFTLQRLLGHRSLVMVRHYLDLADADSKAVHRKASPVDRWHL